MDDYSNANADANIVYVPRAEWEAQGKRIAELDSEAREYLAANKKAERIIAKLEAEMETLRQAYPVAVLAPDTPLRKRIAELEAQLAETVERCNKKAARIQELEAQLAAERVSKQHESERAQELMQEVNKWKRECLETNRLDAGLQAELGKQLLEMKKERDAALADARIAFQRATGWNVPLAEYDEWKKARAKYLAEETK